jgi:hypothetical protein
LLHTHRLQYAKITKDKDLSVTSFLTRLKINAADFKRISVITIIVTNLVPIYGVLFMGWRVFPVMFLFWVENVIIGVSNVLKMALSSPGSFGQWVAKIFMIPFFCIHYGMFTLVHGIFILVFFGGYAQQGSIMPGVNDVFGLIGSLQIGGAVLALILSHTVSFITNYIGKGEYKTANLSDLMAQPYGRVVILHLTIIIGGFLVMAVGAPVVGLIFLIVLKTFVDIKSHLKQHNYAKSEKEDIVVVAE